MELRQGVNLESLQSVPWLSPVKLQICFGRKTQDLTARGSKRRCPPKILNTCSFHAQNQLVCPRFVAGCGVRGAVGRAGLCGWAFRICGSFALAACFPCAIWPQLTTVTIEQLQNHVLPASLRSYTPTSCSVSASPLERTLQWVEHFARMLTDQSP